jgi:hypothetical protein
MHLVQCVNKECTAVAAVTSGDVDVHDALDAAGCRCCAQAHNHGQAAKATGVSCRPVTITLFAGSAGVS